MDYLKLILLGAITLMAAMVANWARDAAYEVHAVMIMLISGAMFIWTLRHTGEPKPQIDANGYKDSVIWDGVIAMTFWGVVGFLVGTFIAFQLAFPEVNFE